jgi:hypothetical protein
VEGREETLLEISCLKGVERNLKLPDTRKPATRSLAQRLKIAAPIHEDLYEENKTEPDDQESRKDGVSGNRKKTRLNLILSQNEDDSNKRDESGQQYGNAASN